MSIFSKVNLKRPKTSTFNLSHDRKFSMNMGYLVPMMVQECVPGDTFNISTSQMLRMMPMIAPVMHEVNVYTHFFFVPNRILWKNWEKFITGGEDGEDETLFPYLYMSNATAENHITPGTLFDYLGYPLPNLGANLAEAYPSASFLPAVAYQMIYNEYYRDQNLIEKVDTTFFNDGMNLLDDNQKMAELFKLRKRAWKHDYLTSALPFAQKGNQ